MNYNYPHFSSEVIQGFYNWQAIIGACLALLAALLGAIFINRQVRQTEAHELWRRRRRLIAARATLPLILSEVIEFLKDATREMLEGLRAARQQGFDSDRVTFAIPPFPISSIEALERMIEATEDQTVTRCLADVLSELQTLRARMSSVRNASAERVGLHRELEEYVLQCADIYVEVERLFPYARMEQDHVAETNPDKAWTALRGLDVSEAQHPELFERLGKRKPRTDQHQQ